MFDYDEAPSGFMESAAAGTTGCQSLPLMLLQSPPLSLSTRICIFLFLPVLSLFLLSLDLGSVLFKIKYYQNSEPEKLRERNSVLNLPRSGGNRKNSWMLWRSGEVVATLYYAMCYITYRKCYI